MGRRLGGGCPITFGYQPKASGSATGPVGRRPDLRAAAQCRRPPKFLSWDPKVSQGKLNKNRNLMWTKRGKARLILIFSTNTNCENMAYRSFRCEEYSARGVRKNSTGRTGMWQPSVVSVLKPMQGGSKSTLRNGETAWCRGLTCTHFRPPFGVLRGQTSRPEPTKKRLGMSLSVQHYQDQQRSQKGASKATLRNGETAWCRGLTCTHFRPSFGVLRGQTSRPEPTKKRLGMSLSG